MRAKTKSAPHTDAFVEELKILLKPRGRKTSLCLFLADGDEDKVQRWRRTILKLINRETSSVALELFFKISAWAKANKLNGREYI